MTGVSGGSSHMDLNGIEIRAAGENDITTIDTLYSVFTPRRINSMKSVYLCILENSEQSLFS